MYYIGLGSIFTGTVIDVISFFIDLLPNFEIPIFTTPQVITTIVNACWYFLPMDVVSTLFSLTVSITLFRLTLSVILRIKSFIPTMGD